VSRIGAGFCFPRVDLRINEAVGSRRLDCPFLFHRNGRRIRDYYHAWRSAAERAVRTGLHLHDFRRSTARNLDRAGVPTGVAMTVMGHKTRSIYDRCNITSEGDLREATAKLSAYLAARRNAPRKTVPLPPRQKQRKYSPRPVW
jgi:integrase